MQNPHGFQQQQHGQLYQANPQLLQAQQQQGQQMPQAMYGIPQQYLQPQQLQQGGRGAAQGLPQQQLHGMQQHPRQHHQPAADNNQDEGFDIMDIPSDDDDGPAAPAAPVGRPVAPAAQQQQSSGGPQGALHTGLGLPQQHQQYVSNFTAAQLQQLQQGRAGVAAQPQQQQQHQQARMSQVQQQLQQQQALGQRPSQAMQPAATANRHMSNVHGPRQGLPQANSLPGANIQPALAQLQAQQKLAQQQQLLAQHQRAAAALGAQQGAAGRAAAVEPVAKRPKTDVLPPAPDDAQSLYEVMVKAERAGVLKPAAGAGAAASSAAAAAAAAGSAADGPSSSIDDILRRAEQQAANARARGLDRGAGDEEKFISEASLKRLMELQALNKAFKLQPDLVDQLQQLTESFVSEAVKFGVDLASHRRGATLRPTDLAMYLERTHHLHVPGFTKEYHPYRRPVASELHRERSIAVRKAQLAAAAAAGDAPAAARGGGGGD